MIATIKAYWRDHGTKLLGGITMLGAACNGGDHYLTQILTNAQHAVISLVLSVTGYLTIQRGFTNSRNTNGSDNNAAN